jgi:eukaryotic-like serine/threonine-protein kinase
LSFVLDARRRAGLVHRCVETLASWIARDGALNELDAVGWIIRLAKGLEPIHALGVAHGSVTAEAVRIEDSSCTSRGFLVDARRLHDLVAYHSPERADGEEISPANDTWAVAVTLYLALTGSLPFPGVSDQDVKKRILGPPASPLAVFDVGDDGLQRILDRAFSRDATKRLTKLRDLRQALEAWHTDPDVSKLPPLDDEGDKEDSSSAYRAMLDARARADDDDDAGESATISVPLRPAAATGVAALQEDDEGATEVRNLSTFQEHLAAYKAQSQPPPPLRSTDRPGRSPTNNPALAGSPARPRDEALAVPRLLGRAEPPGGPRQPPRMMKGGTVPIPNFPLLPPSLDPPNEAGSGHAQAGAAGPFHEEDSEDEPATAIMEPLPASSPAPGLRVPALSPSATAPLQPSPLRTLTPHNPVPAPSGDSFTAPATWSGAQLKALGLPNAVAIPPDPSAATAESDPSALAALGETASQPPAVFADGRPSIGLGPGQPAQAPSNSLLVPLLAGFGLLIAGGAAAFFLFRPRPSSELTTPSATPSTTIVASASTAPTSATPSASPLAVSATGTSTGSPSGTSAVSPSGTGTASPTASSTTSPTAATTTSPTVASTTSPSKPASSSEVNACLTPLFPADTFVEIPPSLGFVCTITDPRKGGGAIRTEVVRAGNRKRVSDGMREWAVLGWYEMAAFAVLRSSCCPSSPPIDIPISIPTCDIETPLRELGTIAASPASDDAKVAAALEAYTTAVRCVARAGGADGFGLKGGPQGGESTTFEKTLKRVRAAAKKR